MIKESLRRMTLNFKRKKKLKDLFAEMELTCRRVEDLESLTSSEIENASIVIQRIERDAKSKQLSLV